MKHNKTFVWWFLRILHYFLTISLGFAVTMLLFMLIAEPALSWLQTQEWGWSPRLTDLDFWRRIGLLSASIGTVAGVLLALYEYGHHKGWWK